MATSRSGAGGKIVTNRRKLRLSATPYDRPPSPPSPAPPPNPTNWFTGLIIPSARAIASGAGKIVSNLFTESESSSSEDEDLLSEDELDSEYDHEVFNDSVKALNEESQLSEQRRDTKHVIEQLIMQETFSREERDRLVKALNSRVDWSTEAGEESLHALPPTEMAAREDDMYDKAILEAKKWFEGKNVGSSSATKVASQALNTNSTGLEHVEEGGSPVDVARSYMNERPPWASATKNVELRTPMTTTMKLFKEGTSFSVSRYSSSSSKKRSSLASGSWNIQEELRRVRSKATEDMLRTPAAKIDPSWFVVARSEQDSEGAAEAVPVVGDRTAVPGASGHTKPMGRLVDAGVSSDPALAALESRQNSMPSETPSAKPATSVSGNNENSEAVQLGGERAASALPYLSILNHDEKHQPDPYTSRINGAPATEVTTECGGEQNADGPFSSQESLSAGIVTGENHEQHDENNHHNVDYASEKESMNNTNVEGNCKLLTEACVEVPIVTEINSIGSGSQNLDILSAELSVDVAEPTKKGNAGVVAGKQQGRKPGRGNRRGRGRGK